MKRKTRERITIVKKENKKKKKKKKQQWDPYHINPYFDDHIFQI